MTMARRRAAVLMVGALATGATLPGSTVAAPAPPGESKAPKRCVAKDDQVNAECAFYSKVAQPKIYAGPTGDQLLVVPGLEASGRVTDHFFNDYIADPGDLASGSRRVRLYHRSKPTVLWVERSDIVRASDLKRVKRCWPIKQLLISNGDEEDGRISFTQDGSGVASNPGEPRQPVHAWYFEGVYSVRSEPFTPKKSASREWAWGNFDLATGRIIDRANWASGQDAQRFDSATMKAACPAGPVTD